MNGVNGGPQLGCNAQFGGLVLGVETDWQGFAGHASDRNSDLGFRIGRTLAS
jgi:hypothetical protein